jgi:hypothetical protein
MEADLIRGALRAAGGNRTHARTTARDQSPGLALQAEGIRDRRLISGATATQAGCAARTKLRSASEPTDVQLARQLRGQAAFGFAVFEWYALALRTRSVHADGVKLPAPIVDEKAERSHDELRS